MFFIGFEKGLFGQKDSKEGKVDGRLNINFVPVERGEIALRGETLDTRDCDSSKGPL